VGEGPPPKLLIICASSDALRLAVTVIVKPSSGRADLLYLCFRIDLNFLLLIKVLDDSSRNKYICRCHAYFPNRRLLVKVLSTLFT
jgi:hypothetical protein